jgi:Leishmanolysin
LWFNSGLATSVNVPCKYTSEASKATDEYRAISGCTDIVPLEESTGNVGSDCGHWDESCFVNELMTPIVGIANPISRVTVGTLQDLGYTVNYTAADSYTTFNNTCKCGSRDLASTDKTMTMMTAHEVHETRHKRSLADPDHPDAIAIANAKEILASMINAAPGPDDVLNAADGSDIVAPSNDTNLWVNIITYDTNTDTVYSYIITPHDL